MSASISDLIEPLQPFANRLVNLGAYAGVGPRVTSTLRSRTQQQRLYRAFLRGETHYPVAPPGTSAHEFGYAFDMVASSTEDLHDLGTVWRQWGGVWSPNDEVHFEYPGFVVPSVPVDEPVTSRGLKVCDFLTGFTPLGGVQLAETLAEWLVPLHCDDPARYNSFDCNVQRLIQGPCSYLLAGK